MNKKIVSIVLGVLILLAAIVSLFLRAEVKKKVEEEYASGDLSYREERYEEAFSAFENFMARHPQDERMPELLYKAGVCQKALERLEDAKTLWQRVVDGFPDSPYLPKAKLELGKLKEIEGDYEGAIVIYKEIVEEFPTMGEAMLSLGASYERAGAFKEAKKVYEELWEKFPEGDLAQKAKERLGETNMRLIFSPAPMEGSTIYEVELDDSLDKIARKFHTTVELLREVNKLKKDLIRPHKRLKVITGKFSIHVDVSDRRLTLMLDDHFIKEYLVGVGMYEMTPIGEFKIIDKKENPTWYSEEGVFEYGDPRNILGTRYMKLDKPGYGIHGTTQPETVGEISTKGCLRMYNKDVEEIYKLLPLGTPVIIEE